MGFRREGSDTPIDVGTAATPAPGTPGKQTLVQRLVSSGMTSTGNGQPTDTAHTDDAVATGTRGAGQPLPHLDAIQRAFGRHDVSGVEAHTGDAAAESSAALGASAFATGNHVVFGTTPSLHTAAHEAAHVVQQRSGLALSGGVGQSGDAHERHADAVADAVVSGGSAGELLDRYGAGADAARAPAAAAAAPVQRTDGVVGPPANGSTSLTSGTLSWSLIPRVGSVNARIEFTPSPATAAACKTISFVQSVTENEKEITTFGFGKTSFGTTQIDKGSSDTDPFYGAQRDTTKNNWKDEPNSIQARPGDYQGVTGPREGSRPFLAGTASKSAVLNDSPMLQPNHTKNFDTVAIVVETGQILGRLSWSAQRWVAGFFNDTTSTIVQRADATEGAQSGFQAMMDEYYNGVTVADAFPANVSDLSAAHLDAGKVTRIVDALKAGSKATVGGAATGDEADPPAISKARAEAVKAHLVSQGAPADKIVLDAYGTDWARTPTAQAGSAPSNRRVQVTIQP